jgi:DnaJ family protein A protein 5
MSNIQVDFNKLKYNLYEILNIQQDSSCDLIKKTFRKVIKNFHPDKNSELEEDIYYHIILAHQVLTNNELRDKYNYHIKNKESTFEELKNGFNSNNNYTYNTSDFNTEMNKLNKMHGYTSFNDNDNTINKFNKIKNQTIIPIQKEDIKSNNDFNKIFDNKNNTSIIQYKEPSELSTYVMGEYYTHINDINKLYIEDEISCSKYTHLNRAFSLQPNLNNIKYDNMSCETRIKEYNNLTNELNTMKFDNVKII